MDPPALEASILRRVRPDCGGRVGGQVEQLAPVVQLDRTAAS